MKQLPNFFDSECIKRFNLVKKYFILIFATNKQVF